MLKPTVKRGLMLDFIPDEIFSAVKTDENRISKLNSKKVVSGDIVYLASRELRVDDNWGLFFAQDLAKKYNLNFRKIIIKNHLQASERQLEFLKNELKNSDFEILNSLSENIGALIVDFNPINLYHNFAQNVDYAVFEIDSHNIIPARYISQKQEFSAATLRRKVYANIAEFLTEYPRSTDKIHPILDEFVQNKLDRYVEYKNDPNQNCTSNLSPYLHFGLITSQRVAIEVLKSAASRENKESFLEELIVRKELSDNYCLYNKKYKSIDGASDWAKATLNSHREDLRIYFYSLEEFEYGKTHDPIWNKIQQKLLLTGKIHGYLRMYWAKKILEWSSSPENALEVAIYLNDTYALDGNDPNGYVGILWSIAGLHDRPFSNRHITGKIRYMSDSGLDKKFDVNQYLNS